MDASPPTHWADWLRAVQRARGLSVSDLAQRAQVSRQTIYTWLDGGPPSGPAATGLIDALDLSRDEQAAGLAAFQATHRTSS